LHTTVRVSRWSRRWKQWNRKSKFQHRSRFSNSSSPVQTA